MTNSSEHPLKVFLCHSSGDKPAVRALYKILVGRGIDAWLDEEKLLPGQEWQIEIPKAVQNSDAIIVCVSNKSITKEGYVQKEIKFALDIADIQPEGRIFVVPLKLEKCPVPRRLSNLHWLNYYERDGYFHLKRALAKRAQEISV